MYIGISRNGVSWASQNIWQLDVDEENSDVFSEKECFQIWSQVNLKPSSSDKVLIIYVNNECFNTSELQTTSPESREHIKIDTWYFSTLKVATEIRYFKCTLFHRFEWNHPVASLIFESFGNIHHYFHILIYFIRSWDEKLFSNIHNIILQS